MTFYKCPNFVAAKIATFDFIPLTRDSIIRYREQIGLVLGRKSSRLSWNLPGFWKTGRLSVWG